MNTVPTFCDHEWYVYEQTNPATEWEISNPNNVPMPKGLKRRQKLLPSETPGDGKWIGMYYLECIKCGCHAEATSPSIWDWLEETDGLQVVMERNFIDPIKCYFPEDCVIIYGPDDEDLNRGHRLIDPDKPDELSMLGLIEHLQQTDRSFRIKVPDENGNGYKEISALEMLEQVRQAESVTRSKEKIKILEV